MISDNQKYNETVQPNTDFLNELKTKLPDFFNKDGSFDLDKFSNQVTEKNVNVQSEGYKLDFIGKDYARRQAGEMPTSVIVPDEEQNNGEGKDSKNLFFTGDNLEVLRHLQTAYANKIDVIYIDPPYNTGNGDFVYPDNFEYTDDQLKDMFDFDDNQVERLKSIQGKASHSAWLTFMYPRLKLARNLLSNEGAIFISIDENEYANLKILMDSIFGENNFIENIVWNKKSSAKGVPPTNMMVGVHEYILSFQKTNGYSFIGVERNLEEDGFKNPDNDPRGPWRESNIRSTTNSTDKAFTIENPKTGEKYTNTWAFSRDSLKRMIDDKRILWKKSLPKQKEFMYEMRNKNKAIVSNFGLFDAQINTVYLKNLLGFEKVFSNPKPLQLMKYLISVSLKKEGTVLDFFAGSSTTADAVMQLNAEDGGHRKFIMVQLPEKTYTVNSDGTEVPTKGGKAAYDAGFKSIDEISRERIRRAAKKIREDNELTLPEDFDGSFKHCRVVKPTKQTLEDIDDFDPNNTDLFTNMVKGFSSDNLNIPGDATGEQTILTTWLAQDGYPFDANVQQIQFGNYHAHMVDNRLYLINEGWSSNQTKQLLNQLGTNELHLQTVVLFGYSFNVAELRGLEIGLKQLDGKVNLIKRY